LEHRVLHHRANEEYEDSVLNFIFLNASINILDDRWHLLEATEWLKELVTSE
jgi:hypothetical protein